MLSTLQLGHVPLEYVESGRPDRPPLVLLTGWALDHRLFRTLVPFLEDEFRVVRLNFRGHDSHLTDVGDFTASDLASDVISVVEHLGLSGVRFVSTSHGCWVNIEVNERLGDRSLGRTVIIDWLMQPFEGFDRQIREGAAPETVVEARASLFAEWTEGSGVLDVLDHVHREMTWFGTDMWMRACREIGSAYATWGSPLERMAAVPGLQVRHIYSQPLAAEYREFQEAYARDNPWFDPVHLPGQTHFPTLEDPAGVAEAITSFYR